jgi:hypothetical protein
MDKKNGDLIGTKEESLKNEGGGSSVTRLFTFAPFPFPFAPFPFPSRQKNVGLHTLHSQLSTPSIPAS